MSEEARAWVCALAAVSGLAEAGRTLPQRLPKLAARFGPLPALLDSLALDRLVTVRLPRWHRAAS